MVKKRDLTMETIEVTRISHKFINKEATYQEAYRLNSNSNNNNNNNNQMEKVLKQYI